MLPYTNNQHLLHQRPLFVRVAFPQQFAAPQGEELKKRTLGCWPISLSLTGVWGTVLSTLQAGLPAYIVSTHQGQVLAAYRIVQNAQLAPANQLYYNFNVPVNQVMCHPAVHADYQAVIGNFEARIGSLFMTAGNNTPTIYVHGEYVDPAGLQLTPFRRTCVPMERFFPVN